MVSSKRVSFYFLLISVFLLPLLTFDTLLVRPMIVPVVLLWVASSVLLLTNLLSLKKSWIFIHKGILILGAYLIFEITKDAVSAPHFRALFGDARGPFTGILTSVSLLIIYFTAVQFSNDDKARNTILSTMLASLGIVGVLAVLQHFVQVPFLKPSVRAYATLPNPVELAGICLLMLGVAAIKNPPESPFIKGGEEMGSYTVARGVALMVISLAIVSSGSKIAIVLLAACLLFFMLNSSRAKQYTTAGLLLAISIISLLIYYASVSQHYADSSKFGPTQLSETAVTSSMDERKEIWGTTVKMWLEKPFAGWGQANFPDAFTKTLKQRFGEKTDKLVVFDVHNWVLDVLAKGGLVKLAIMILAFYWFARNIYWKSRVAKYISVSIGVYFVFLLFNPSYLVSKVYFVILLGSLPVKESKSFEFSLPDNNLISKAVINTAAVAGAVFLIFNLYFGGLRIAAEVIGSKGINAAIAGYNDRAILYSKQAANIFPYEPDYWQRLGWSYKMRYSFNNSGDDLPYALEAYRKGLLLAPGDASIQKRINEITKELSNRENRRQGLQERQAKGAEDI